MKKKSTIILSCCAMIAISIVLLLIFVVVNQNDTSQFFCSATDIEICKGDIVYNYYEVTDDRAEISISVNKDDIIEINDMYIKGLQAGEVEVTIIAIYNEKTSVAVFTVKVYAQSYKIKFYPIVDCEIEGNTLVANAKSFQFTFEVYDVLNRKVEDLKFAITITGNASFVKNFYTIMVTANENCCLTIYFEEFDFEAVLVVECFKE